MADISDTCRLCPKEMQPPYCPLFSNMWHLAQLYAQTSGGRTQRVSNRTNVSSHQTVNHSIEFVNSVTGVHTEHIESYWNRTNIKLRRMRGCHENELLGYLDEFLWRERRGNTAREAFTNIMSDIATQYPLP